MRYFNTTGPCDSARHYMLPASVRLPRARQLVEEGRYFVVHAPRQTGKTTTITALAREVTAVGGHAALRVSIEGVGPLGEDISAVELAVLDSIRQAADRELPAELRPPRPWPDAATGTQLGQGLMDWAVACPLPLALLIDEIDTLQGNALVSVLRQLRSGFSYKAQAFPDSVVLCGMRDLKDYRVAAGSGPVPSSPGSPFNILEDSLRIMDFTRDEVTALYRQHTEETGQEFTPEAIGRAYDYSQGQPWLVNALAYEITRRMEIQPPEPITADHVDTAKERLVLSGAVHLDSLSARLHEPRIQRFIEPLLAGTLITTDPAYNDDLRYARDLGLIAPDDPVRVANPVYREIIVRDLAAASASQISESPSRFVLPDGRLDLPALLDAFIDFWLENGEFMTANETYHEAAAQLVFMGFLQRIVNGGGFIDREYAVGSGRTDILIRKPYGNHRLQREAIELKAWAPGKADPLKAGLKQLDGYLDRFRLDTGTLIIFDRRPSAPSIADRTQLSKETTPSGRVITLLRA
ncbi:MAG: ATP-binding protein [Nocardiopsaceae bacterium]|nr:ATP-binding protein [Nocardiopsaceae bacterium]